MIWLTRTAAAFACVLLSATLGVAQAADSGAAETPSNADGWKTIIYPINAWVPIFGAEVRLPDRPDNFPEAKTSGNLDSAFAAGFRLERSRFDLDVTLLWAGLSATVDRPHFDLSLDTIYGQALGGFRVAPALYLEGGVRRIAVDLTAEIETFPSVTWKPGIWESVAGLTFRPNFGRAFRLKTHADIGGLEDGDHKTATATAILEWKPFSHFSFGAGWGVLYFRADGTILGEPVRLRQTLNGPFLTIGIPF